MSFRCEFCDKVVKDHVVGKLLTVETRPRVYPVPYRPRRDREDDRPANDSQPPEGFETVKEIRVCPSVKLQGQTLVCTEEGDSCPYERLKWNQTPSPIEKSVPLEKFKR